MMWVKFFVLYVIGLLSIMVVLPTAEEQEDGPKHWLYLWWRSIFILIGMIVMALLIGFGSNDEM